MFWCTWVPQSFSLRKKKTMGQNLWLSHATVCNYSQGGQREEAKWWKTSSQHLRRAVWEEHKKPFCCNADEWQLISSTVENLIWGLTSKQTCWICLILQGCDHLLASLNPSFFPLQHSFSIPHQLSANF